MSYHRYHPTQAQLTCISAFAAFFFAVSLLTGCSAPERLHGTTTDSGPGFTETVICKPDETYVQTVDCSDGRVLTKTGHWSSERDNGGDDDADYQDICVGGLYDTTNCCLNRSNPKTINLLFPQGTLEGNSQDSQPDPRVGQALRDLLVWMTFMLWVWALVGICRRRFDDVNKKIGWVIGITLCGAVGSALHLIYGRNAGTIPGQKRR